jgi:hypothetical protein
MSWTIEATSSGTFELPPAGTSGAVLVGLVDLGNQWVEFDGGPGKLTHQICLVWELPDIDQPCLVSKIFTWSLNQKAGLRKLISGWRGKDLADKEKFDISKLVGQKCMLSISHQTKGDRTSYKIESVSACPKGMTVGKPGVEPAIIAVGSEVPEWMPRLYGKTMQDYWEMAEAEKEKSNHQSNGGEPRKKAAISDDEVPF